LRGEYVAIDDTFDSDTFVEDARPGE